MPERALESTSLIFSPLDNDTLDLLRLCWNCIVGDSFIYEEKYDLFDFNRSRRDGSLS